MDSKQLRLETAAYLKEARSWETDKVTELLASRRTAWRVASVASFAAVLAVGAVVGLTPLKRTEPFIVKVDNSTGIVELVSAIKDSKMTYEESLNKYFTQWYVRYREGYTRELAPEYYVDVGYLSNPAEAHRYYDWFTPKNPASPLNKYGDKAKVKIQIKGTSFIKPNVALVRYMKSIERNGTDPEITHWAATVTFKYSGAPMDEKARAINPLGFQVVDYRNDPESVLNDSTIRPAQTVDQPQPSSAFANPNLNAAPTDPAAPNAVQAPGQ